ncbi:SDR family oxidoreductase [Microbacterium sp. NPDC089320]|uniref:SDR family NAD(P)-dependent oxidoreductase n=1 Tax=Microbacterium sp. NPDC089320 TaxID=3155182 RepID=UPI0034286532
MSDFEGLTAIVTGGASGIGAATVAELQRRGARVAIIDRAASTDAETPMVRADLGSADEVQAAVEQIARDFGGIDVLINNAGIGAAGDVTANDDAEWHRVLDINVVGTARVTRAALPWLRRSSASSIVNTASVTATNGLPNRALYSASKGAVIAMTYAMAADHLADGIRVNAIAPGTADTPWVKRIVDSADDAEVAAENLRRRQPLGRLVSAAELAFAIANLASPLAGSTTGTVLTVDGGLSTLRVG